VKPFAALVAIMVLILSGLLAGPLAGPADAAPVTGAGPLALELDQVGPRVVTADGPVVLTVTGTVRNIGDETVDELQIRVQRGEPLTTEGQLRDALDGNAVTDAVAPRFAELPGELAPGAEMPVQLTVPLLGTPESGGLGLGTTGVHELLVNVNGVPAGGERTRLASVRMLLPVLSLPPEPGTAADEPEPPATGTPVTVLYPIVDEPRRLPTVPGEPALLTDDELAASFAAGGRLAGLVAALAERAPVGSPVREAVCVAVDPALVETAAAMSEGYQVLGPDGVPVPGGGDEAAASWLAALAAATRGGCLLALPYADADLVALTRGGLSDLARTGIVDGRTILADILGTPALPGTTWPVEGAMNEATMVRTVAPEGEALVLSADGIAQDGERRARGVVPIAGGQRPQVAVLTDPLLTRAATGPGTAVDGPTAGLGATATPAGTGAPLATQDLIGALAFRARQGPAAGRSGPLVVAPPHRWAADGTGAGELLGAVDLLVAEGLLTPRELGRVTAAGPPPGAEAERLAYPPAAGGREIALEVVARIRGVGAAIADLRSAAVEDARVGAAPAEMFDPLHRSTLWPASSAWRGRPALATAAAGGLAERVAEIRARVRVLEPPSPFSLGASDAPLLLTVANNLPVTVTVRLELASTNGLRVAPVPVLDVPPLGRRQVEVSAQVTRSGQFTVQASVRTPQGGLLSPPSRLQVRSTAYGTVTVWLTAIAGGLLVVLAARRVLHRVRGEPGRHAAGSRPNPSRPPDPPRPPPAPPRAERPPTGSTRSSPAGIGTRPPRPPQASSAPPEPPPRVPTRWR
jgi:hypothetical protein